MLLPAEKYIERSKFYLLQPIEALANCDCRDYMTNLVIGRESELHARPTNSFLTSFPSLLTLYTTGSSFSLLDPLSGRRITDRQLNVDFERVAPEIRAGLNPPARLRRNVTSS